MIGRPMPRAVGWSLALWVIVVVGTSLALWGFPGQRERITWLLWLPLWASALVLMAEAWRSFWEEAPAFEMQVPVLSAEEALFQWRDARRALWLLPWGGLLLWPFAWGYQAASGTGGRLGALGVLLSLGAVFTLFLFRRRWWWFGAFVVLAAVTLGLGGWTAYQKALTSRYGQSALLLGCVFVLWCGVILRQLRAQEAYRSSLQVAWWCGMSLAGLGLWVGSDTSLGLWRSGLWWGLLALLVGLGAWMVWRAWSMVRERRLYQAWSLDAAVFAASVPWACFCALWSWEITRSLAQRAAVTPEMLPMLGWLGAQVLLYGALVGLERLHDPREASGVGGWLGSILFFGVSLFVLGLPAAAFLRP